MTITFNVKSRSALCAIMTYLVEHGCPDFQVQLDGALGGHTVTAQDDSCTLRDAVQCVFGLAVEKA